MFSIPRPPALETFDGAPLVRLSDSANDMEKLLNALYNPEYVHPHAAWCNMAKDSAYYPNIIRSFAYSRYNPRTPSLVTGILLLAKKYQMDSIRTLILRNIEHDWPYNLAGWDSLLLEKARSEDVDFEDTDITYPEPASAIRLAIDFNCPSILPAAMYSLSLISFNSGRSCKSQLPKVQCSPSYRLATTKRSADWSILTAKELIWFGRGRERLRTYINDVFDNRPDEIPNSGIHICADKTVCMEGLTRELSATFRMSMSDVCPDALQILDELATICSKYSVCFCSGRLERSFRGARDKLWEDLEDIFQLYGVGSDSELV